MKAIKIIVTMLIVVLNAAPCYSIDFWLDEYLRVPSEYPTIQDAIDAAIEGNTVLVYPSTYTGEGNRDIDFRGKAIIVKSSHGPECTTIDCENLGIGFHFQMAENTGSRLEGLCPFGKAA